jgi:hypothetical protein
MAWMSDWERMRRKKMNKFENKIMTK